MRSTLILPILFLLFGVVSILILQSIAPGLVGSQLLFFVIGAAGFAGLSAIPMSVLKKLAPLGYVFIVLSLLATLLVGSVTRGSTRWIELGPVNYQPSQFAIPALIFFSAWILTRTSLTTLRSFSLVTLLLGIPLGLIFIEPDLDTTIVLGVSIALVVFVSDIRPAYMFGTIALAILGAMLSWTLLLQPYQKQRILTFSGDSDPQGAGYNALQSKIAVGSGQLTGRGLGHGVQSQLRFLPERQTDFIFASLAEETGFVGASFVLIIYVLLIIFLVYILNKSSTPFHRYILVGMIGVLTFQVFVNVGMNMGLLPIAGLTLPLISYGGSSVVAFSLLLGIAQRIVIEERFTNVHEIR